MKVLTMKELDKEDYMAGAELLRKETVNHFTGDKDSLSLWYLERGQVMENVLIEKTDKEGFYIMINTLNHGIQEFVTDGNFVDACRTFNTVWQAIAR